MKRLFMAIAIFFMMVGVAIGADLEVELAWDANTETDLAGYNIYRSETDGPPYEKLGSTINTGYIDGAVDFDVHYYYVVTAYDLTENESGYSNQVSAFTATPDPPDETPPGAPTITVTTKVVIGP